MFATARVTSKRDSALLKYMYSDGEEHIPSIALRPQHYTMTKYMLPMAVEADPVPEARSSSIGYSVQSAWATRH